MTTRQRRSLIPLEPDIGVAHALELSPDGRTLATGHGQGRIWLWDPITLQRRMATSPHEGDQVMHIALSPDGREMLSIAKVWGQPNFAGIRDEKP